MSPAGTQPRRPVLLAACAPFVAAFALRVIAGFAMPEGRGGSRGFDFFGYMADNLLGGQGLGWWFYEGLGWKAANRGPLLPLVLAAVRWCCGGTSRVAEIGVLAAIGAAGIAVPALLARRWAGERAARIALWAAALWPYAVVSDTALVEQVLYAPLCGLAAWAWLRAGDCDREVRRSALLAGAAAGAAALARLTFVVTVPFLTVAAFRRCGLKTTLVVAAGCAAVLAPWVVRNRLVIGHWALGTDGGRALYLGNHEATFTRYPARSIDEGEIMLYRSLPAERMDWLRAAADDEVEQDRRFRELAIASIAAEPGAVAWRMLRKAAALWSPVYNPGPTGALKLAVFAATFLPLVGAACAGAVVCARLRADLPTIVALVASFTLVGAVFWGQPRYLAPLHGVGLAMAAAWLARRPETPT